MAARLRKDWMLLGAQTRLVQLDHERLAILKAFPKLKRASGASSVLGAPRPKRRISAKARQAMSEGMRRFWARRKAAKKQ